MCFVDSLPNRIRSSLHWVSSLQVLSTLLCSFLLEQLMSPGFRELELSCGIYFIPRLDHLKDLKTIKFDTNDNHQCGCQR